MIDLSQTFLDQKVNPTFQFIVPPELEAHEPPEYRGLRRDHVRLLALDRTSGRISHTRFDLLGEFLNAGDLLVVNTSRTLPALLHGRDEYGQSVEVRLARRLDQESWEVLLLDGRTHIGRVGMHLEFGNGLNGVILGRRPDLSFLWHLRFDQSGAQLMDSIYRLGEPVRYSYVNSALPLDLYQTVYAGVPGSVEMPSAGRPLSWQLLQELKRQGIGLATIQLHTSLSSTRDDAIDGTHPNYEEEFQVSPATAAVVNKSHEQGGRVIAVGTTVVRALETVARSDGAVEAGQGLNHLHIDSSHRLRAVDGLLTGFHEPQASHLDLLSALVAPRFLENAYAEAISNRYLWHEFGDMNLII